MSGQTAEMNRLPKASAFSLVDFMTGWPAKALGWIYLDKRGNGSRPKLLCTVAALDVVAVVVAHAVALRVAMPGAAFGAAQAWQCLAVSLLLTALLHSFWSYSISALRRLPTQMGKALFAAGIIALAVAGAQFLTGAHLLVPHLLATWMALLAVLLILLRAGVAGAIGGLTRAGRLRRRTVIVGGGKEADDLMAAFAKDDNGHLHILGVFDDRQGERGTLGNGTVERIGTFEDLAAFCAHEGVDLAIVTVPARAEERLLHVLHKMFALSVDIRISAHNARIRFNAGAYNYIGEVPMLAVMDKPLSDWSRLIKSIEDRALAAAFLLLLAPVMALVALAVRFDSRGPSLFKQRRYGFNNELIEVYKFRSMFTEATDATADKLVTRGDPRVTRVGRFIRRSSLDELPQLFNVLTGQMSLVGPRPHATRAKAGQDLYEDVVHGYFARHRVKPGVTGWAQINGWRGETDTKDKIQGRVACDLEYIDRWSLPFDLYILAMTPLALLTGKNAF